mmetsp:Transcript_30128/g.99692  ORF Transcript_30128/g.99692 Transcript_30128/m.99692 type:complete len:292 (+) Transcript_30128:324-1199(+)
MRWGGAASRRRARRLGRRARVADDGSAAARPADGCATAGHRRAMRAARRHGAIHALRAHQNYHRSAPRRHQAPASAVVHEAAGLARRARPLPARGLPGERGTGLWSVPSLGRRPGVEQLRAGQSGVQSDARGPGRRRRRGVRDGGRGGQDRARRQQHGRRLGVSLRLQPRFRAAGAAVAARGGRRERRRHDGADARADRPRRRLLRPPRVRRRLLPVRLRRHRRRDEGVDQRPLREGQLRGARLQRGVAGDVRQHPGPPRRLRLPDAPERVGDGGLGELRAADGAARRRER